MTTKPSNGELIPKHGGYRKLLTHQLASLVYELTVRFCDKFIAKYSRTNDQMIQAARSGVQNIAEGSQASGTSKKNEMKLTNVARASLEELFEDYRFFLFHKKLQVWERSDKKRSEYIAKRFTSPNDVVRWIQQVAEASNEPIAQVAANTMVVLIGVTNQLLNRQIAAQADAFKKEGGFTERLYNTRKAHRGNTQQDN